MFISYSRKDTQAARFVKSYIYKTCRKNRRPKEEISIFFDVDNFYSNELSEGLSKNIAASEYLLLICSKNSSNSEFVEKEVSHFLSVRDKSRLILLQLGEYVESSNEIPAIVKRTLNEPRPFTLKRGMFKVRYLVNDLDTICAILLGRDKREFVQVQRKRRIFNRARVSGLVLFFVSTTYLTSSHFLRPGLSSLLEDFKLSLNLIVDQLEVNNTYPETFDEAIDYFNQSYTTLSTRLADDLKKPNQVHPDLVKLSNQVEEIDVYLRKKMGFEISKLNLKNSLANPPDTESITHYSMKKKTASRLAAELKPQVVELEHLIGEWEKNDD